MKEKNKTKILAIGGPTASGKTEAALILAGKFNGVIISCDSRQIYRELDVATDKIPFTMPNHDPIVYEGIEHYGINIAEVDKPFTLFDWQKYAFETIKSITVRGKLPMLVGGTGLYIQAVIDNYDLADGFDRDERDFLNKLPLSELQNRLKGLDRQAYENIDQQNPRRLIRVIEKLRNKDAGASHKKRRNDFDFDSLVLSFEPDRKIIEEKIRRRVGKHQELGVIDEVQHLVKKFGADNQILNSTISIQEYIPYVLGKIGLAEAQERVVINNRRYAKRQMTWFKKYGGTIFCRNITEMERKIDHWLKY